MSFTTHYAWVSPTTKNKLLTMNVPSVNGKPPTITVHPFELSLEELHDMAVATQQAERMAQPYRPAPAPEAN